MNDFKDKISIIISWANAGGDFQNCINIKKFYEWLLTLNMDEKEIDNLMLLVTKYYNLDFEDSAKIFLSNRT